MMCLSVVYRDGAIYLCVVSVYCNYCRVLSAVLACADLFCNVSRNLFVN